MSAFRVSISYPDGHVEELEDVFNTLEDAKRFGEGYLMQVKATEDLKGKEYDEDGLEKKRYDAYFMVIESNESGRMIVFESKHKKKR